MLKHFKTLWNSLEFVAAIQKCSCSKLAVNGTLDSTIFNKSKRYSKYGQPRWISFGTLVQTLNGNEMSMLDFAVIYEILYIVQTNIDPQVMQKIMSDVDTLLKHHIDKLNHDMSVDQNVPESKNNH